MFLEKIVEIKKEEVCRRKALVSRSDLEERTARLPPPRDLLGAFSLRGPIAVIAEIKRASPSAGVIREEIDPCQLAREYEAGGACAVSVLTESTFFKGDLAYLHRVKEEISLPVLQKDFVLDRFQIYEGRASGADAVLLIACLLDQDELREFASLAQDLGMTPLVEIHDHLDLEKTSRLDLPLIGINNRDLKTFEVDLRTTLRLRKEIPPGTKVISESGIRNPEDVRRLKEARVDGILVGEILMRASDPASKIREFLSVSDEETKYPSSRLIERNIE